MHMLGEDKTALLKRIHSPSPLQFLGAGETVAVAGQRLKPATPFVTAQGKMRRFALKGQAGKAKKYYQKALSASPDNFVVHRSMGLALEAGWALPLFAPSSPKPVVACTQAHTPEPE